MPQNTRGLSDLTGKAFLSPGGQNVLAEAGFTATQQLRCLHLRLGREKAGEQGDQVVPREMGPLKKTADHSKTIPSSLLPGSLPEWRPTHTIHRLVCSHSLSVFPPEGQGGIWRMKHVDLNVFPPLTRSATLNTLHHLTDSVSAPARWGYSIY